MKTVCFWLLSIALFPFSLSAQEVYVHELSVLHMESSGGWIAAEKGFYGKLTVHHLQGGSGNSPLKGPWLPSGKEVLPSG